MQNLREACLRAFQSAIDSVQPYQRVYDALRIGEHINSLNIGGRTYQIDRNVHLAAFGKAALGMVRGAEAALNGHIVEGLASVPRGTIQKIVQRDLRTKFLEGATNNLPDVDSCANAALIEQMAHKLQSPNDLFLVLISGGGSALLSAPLQSITLEEKCKTIKAMTSRGAEIKQLNIVRQALSRLKGGKLAQIAAPAKTLSVIISDIVGDPLEYIASGPTVLKQAPNLGAETVLRELGAWDAIPSNVQNELLKSQLAEQDNQHVDAQNVIISNNLLALSSVTKTLENADYRCHLVSSTIAMDANQYGRQLAQLIDSFANGQSINGSLVHAGFAAANCELPNTGRVALLFGGECTVKTRGNGKGGRNQQIVLCALAELLKNRCAGDGLEFALLSAGTDGQDGPTDAAGALLTGDDLQFVRNNGAAAHVGERVQQHLANNDSYNFWRTFRDGRAHIRCGPTGTNVMDIQVLMLNRLL